MEEMEVPTEHLHEHINEHAGHSKDKWSMYLAVSTAIMAVMAAFGSLLAGHHSNEALISQIRSSDQWAYYQAKGIKYEILHSTIRLDKEGAEADRIKADMAKYKTEQAEITAKANEFEKESEIHLQKHNTVSYGVTLFQIAIAISAIAMLTGKRFMWYFSIVLSLGGVVMLALSYR
jgi:hypothetical protein